ncbi:MAG: amino acid adenylation domain-containing protein [Acidobacteria bacterium]|nr:amino acid adenylation domain-containing protein [Acidobacteriota bacterium]MBI3488944.1 amino acid adenylation domain-containing protein [Acidobacteriota bacterium]
MPPPTAIPPSTAALLAFARLAQGHLGEDGLLLDGEAEGGLRQASVRLGDGPSTKRAAETLALQLGPSAAYVLTAKTPAGGAPFSGHIQISGREAMLEMESGTTPTMVPWVLRHFARLHRGILEAPEASPEIASMADEEERALLLGPFSGPAFDPELSLPESLVDRFEATVRRHGARPAVEEDGRTWTYAELNAMAEDIALGLQHRGLGPGSLVGHWMPRGLPAYAALLGILKCGAAYVPLDPGLPSARVRQVAVECGMHLLLASASLGTVPGLPCPMFDPALDFARDPGAFSAAGPGPGDLAYVIFTSGSTGTPKGVPITHRSACTLVRAEQRLFAPCAEDRVFQGFSLAFDASVEELWLAWASGACLVAGTPSLMQAGPDLGRRLTEAGITVLSTVPTLLGLLSDPVPTLRLLILGGEACPEDLVAHWWRPGLRMVNTYGPTEATVISTWTDLRPGQAVTIGKAVPNDRIYVLDAQSRLCPIGVPGELHLSGVGLSSGYLGRTDLTAERFITNPFHDGPFTERLYRTGDRVRFNAEGHLEFLGRIDTQIKLRGFRIELEEIEAALRQEPEVLAAAVALWKADGPERLVAYVVLRPSARFDADGLLRGLRQRLPSYMVPASVDALGELPTLASGKLDRKRLPAPSQRQAPSADGEGLTPTQRTLREQWTQLFQGRAPGLDEDFFRDLGGHSLLAAAMVSTLRPRTGFENLAVPDVYAFPTLRALAAELDGRRASEPGPAKAKLPPAEPLPAWRYGLCVLAQLLSLYPLLGFYALQWLSPYLVYSWSQDHDISRFLGISAALLSLILIYPAMFVLSIAAKWLLLGRIRPGRHRVWGFYYWRWWLTQRIIAATPLDYLVESPWLALYFRLMGARIGSSVHLATTSLAAFDLTRIGDEASIGQDARLSGYTLEDGFLELGPIRVGRRCYVGNRSILCAGTVMEDGAILEDLSLLPGGARIATAQRWAGSPARPLPPRTSDRSRLSADLPRPSRGRQIVFAAIQALGACMVPMAFLLAIFPGLVLINELYASTPGYFAYLVVAPGVALSFVALLALEIAAAKWLLLGRVRPGTYGLYSGFVLRKWYVDRLMAVGLDLLAPLYATLYLAPWFRLLGAKLGAWAEVSTAGSGCPDLLEIGDESFIADCVSFGPPRVDLGQVILATTQVGRRAFVGNSALVPSGTALGDSVLVGVLSVPPGDPLEAARTDSSWLGSPAIYLPHRQESAAFGEAATFRPPKRMILLRAFIEQFRVLAPATGFVVITSLLLTALTEIEEASSLGAAALSLPLLYFAGGLAACLFVVAVKWAAIGRYKPCEKPLWCSFIWRTELVSGLHENLADSWLLRLLAGTPLVPLYFRLLGARIGSRVCMESTWLTEYDLVDIGDGAQLNSDCTIQTHLFEDRVMKMDRIHLGAGCSVGMDSVVLYGSRMESGSVLGDLSLVMKGEALPAGTRWEGSPARPSQRSLETMRIPGDAPGQGHGGVHPPADMLLLAGTCEIPGLAKLEPDACGRPRALGPDGRPVSMSVSRAPGAHLVAWSARGRVGADLECLGPSPALEVASALFLPGERAWADTLPPQERWRGHLLLWTAKEAVMKALGQGFAFGMDQIELEPADGPGLRLRSLCGSARLARGWRVEHQEREVAGRTYLVALVVG